MISKKQRHFGRTDSGFFKKLRSITIGAIWDMQADRALRVFEVFAATRQKIAAGHTLTDEEKSWLDETIRSDLDHESIGHFVQMVLEFQQGMEQSENALAGHAENHAMREQIYAWLDANKTQDMSMDSAASAIANKVVPLAWRTVRDHVSEWKKVRAASKA